MKQLEIFNYSDHRLFLQYHLESKKKQTPSWSLGQWAKHLGLANTASLSNIIKGRRSPSDSVQKSITNYFNFNKEESEYFSTLVKLYRYKDDPELSVHFMEKLGNLHPDKKFSLLDESSFRSISYWYYYVVREMVKMKNFVEDPQWIAKHLYFKVTPAQISMAIEELLKLKLLKRDKQEILIYSDKNILPPQDIASEALKRFHEGTLENAKKAIREIDVNQREFFSLVFSFKNEDMVEAKKDIRKFFNDFNSKFDKAEADNVYQLNIQFYPNIKDS